MANHNVDPTVSQSDSIRNLWENAEFEPCELYGDDLDSIRQEMDSAFSYRPNGGWNDESIREFESLKT